MKNGQKKISKVMKEFKKGELNIGQSSKKVKSPKQAIAIALSESGMSKKGYAKGGLIEDGTSMVVKRDFMGKHKGQFVNHSDFTNSDGYLNGGVDIEMTNPTETQEQYIQGQEKVIPEKRRKAKWY